MTVKTRNDFPALLTSMGLTGNAVEVGVAEGYNSWNILDNWAGKLFVVDPYAILNEPGFSGHGEATQAGQDARYERIVKIAAKYKGRAVVMRTTSEDAAMGFAIDGTRFDFIYLDAQHDYDSVRADIARWWPLAKPGSIFSGHDFLDGPVHGGSQTYGVKRAVNEHAARYGLTVNVIPEEWPSWYIRVPEGDCDP